MASSRIRQTAIVRFEWTEDLEDLNVADAAALEARWQADRTLIIRAAIDAYLARSPGDLFSVTGFSVMAEEERAVAAKCDVGVLIIGPGNAAWQGCLASAVTFVRVNEEVPLPPGFELVGGAELEQEAVLRLCRRHADALPE